MPKSTAAPVQPSPAVAKARSEDLHGAVWLLFLQVLIPVGFGLGLLASLSNRVAGTVLLDVTMGAALAIGISQLVGSRRAVDRLIWTLVCLICAAVAVPLALAALHIH